MNAGPLQYGIAVGLDLPDQRFEEVADDLRIKRDRLRDGLTAAGLTVFPAAGAYFLTVDIRSIGETDGVAFCRSLPERCGVVAVPNAVFYDDVEAGSAFVRFACCKGLDVIDEAAGRLGKLA